MLLCLLHPAPCAARSHSELFIAANEQRTWDSGTIAATDSARFPRSKCRGPHQNHPEGSGAPKQLAPRGQNQSKSSLFPTWPCGFFVFLAPSRLRRRLLLLLRRLLRHRQHNIINTTSSTRPINTTPPSTQHHQHNTTNTSSSTHHHQHDTIYTTSSTLHHLHYIIKHNIINTTPSTQHHLRNIIHTTNHQHNTNYTTPSSLIGGHQSHCVCGRCSSQSISVSFCVAGAALGAPQCRHFAWQVQHLEHLQRGPRKSGDD